MIGGRGTGSAGGVHVRRRASGCFAPRSPNAGSPEAAGAVGDKTGRAAPEKRVGGSISERACFLAKVLCPVPLSPGLFNPPGGFGPPSHNLASAFAVVVRLGILFNLYVILFCTFSYLPPRPRACLPPFPTVPPPVSARCRQISK